MKCDKCSSEMAIDYTMVLTSNPPKPCYYCITCEPDKHKLNVISFDCRYMDFDLEDEKNYGRLYLDDKGKLSFEGDVNDSAKVLFELVCTMFNKK